MGNVERVNRLWVALIDGFTEENNKIIQHTAVMVKFILPDTMRNNIMTNDRETASWFYLNYLDFISTMGECRMINAADLSEKIVELIPYKLIPCTDKAAVRENYDKNIFGFISK